MRYKLKQITAVKIENEDGITCFLPNCNDVIGYGILRYYGLNNVQFLNKFVLFEIKSNVLWFSVAE